MSTRMTAAGAAMSALIAGAGAASAGDWAGRMFDRLDGENEDRVAATQARALAAERFAHMAPGGTATSGAATDAARTRLAKRFESTETNGDGAALRAGREVRAGKRLRDFGPDADGARGRDEIAGWREG